MLEQNNVSRRNTNVTWKTFVRESGNILAVSPTKTDEYLASQGKKARKAYEEIINEKMDVILKPEYNHCESRMLSKRSKAQKLIIPNEKLGKNQISTGNVTVNSILKAVEQKDWTFLSRHVTGENVNLTDNFGWTPLMSAAYCGHLDIIEFLLNLGANKYAKEKSDLTAAQLALKKNYLNIVALLKKRPEHRLNKPVVEADSCVLNINIDDTLHPRLNFMESRKNYGRCGTEENNSIQECCDKGTGFYCNICDVNFYQTTWKVHETSTLHIFNSKPKLPHTMYGIPKQNKGYQMLLNHGWDEQSGLGPLGKGIKFPIKTCLKSDRKGLGQSNEKEYRVTHLKDENNTLINDLKISKSKCLKKKDKEKLLNREVRKDRALRIVLS